MLMLAAAAAVGALAAVLAGLSFALASVFDTGAAHDLRVGAAWVGFAAWLIAIVAVARLGWQLILESRWTSAAEIGGVVISVLLITIGALVDALDVTGRRGSGGGVLAAVGFGLLGLAVLVVAARQSIAEFRENVQPHRRSAYLWSFGAGAAILYAIAVGLTDTPLGLAGTTDVTQGDLIASGVLALLCWAVLIAVAAGALRVGIARLATVQGLVVALGILVLSAIALIVAAATQIPVSADLTGFRVAFSLPEFLLAVGLLVLASISAARGDAFGGLASRVQPAPRPAPAPPGPTTPPAAETTPMPVSPPEPPGV